MSRWVPNLFAYGAYVAGGALLTLAGPVLTDVHPGIALVAASATTVVFMLLHAIFDTRRLVRAALVEAGRRRRELAALGRYVATLEQRDAMPAPDPQPAPVLDEDDVPVATSNLLQFAARVSARCAGDEKGAAVGADDDAAMQDIVSDAIRAARLDLHLQPIVRLDGRETVHFEALSRLRDRSGNVIAPARFLPAAVAAGVAPEFETQQLASVVSLCNRIGSRHPQTRIFCNLSAAALANDGFRTELGTFMESHAELAGRLVFEMHAATAMALHTEAVADLRALDDLGFCFSADQVSLADLGKVFSVFGRLGFAKVDAAELVAADPNVIRALVKGGTTIVASRVETEAEAAGIVAVGVEFAQGSLFGTPKRAKMAPERRRAA